jgi:predicted exporter
VEGDNPQEVLEREETLTARLRELVRSDELEYYQAVSDFVPSLRRQREAYTLWRDHIFAPTDTASSLLVKNGFRGDVVARYAADFRRSADRTLALDDWLGSPASAPFKHLWLGSMADRYVSVVMPVGFKSVAALESVADGLTGVNLADKAGDVSRLFRGYRRSGSVLLAVAALLVYAVLAWRYGLRQGLWAMLPTLAAIGITLAYGGYAATAMTLFTIMALLLVLGVGINYVIFLHEGIERRAAALVGVLLSAATTLLSFGLLAWSATPALGQFGATLFVGIIVTVLLAPVLGPSSTKVRR